MTCFEGQEFEGHECRELGFLRGAEFRQAGFDSVKENGKAGEVLGVEALLLDEFPQPFDQVQIGRVRR